MKTQEEIDREWASLEVEPKTKEEKKEDDNRFSPAVVIGACAGFVLGMAVNVIFKLGSSYAMWIGLLVGTAAGGAITKVKKKYK